MLKKVENLFKNYLNKNFYLRKDNDYCDFFNIHNNHYLYVKILNDNEFYYEFWLNENKCYFIDKLDLNLINKILTDLVNE